MTDKKSAMNKRITSHLSGVRSSANSLKALSRDLLTYVPETKDAPAVIRLIEGESPTVRRKLTQFFSKFIGWEFNPKSERYGKMKKEKVVQSKLEDATEALKDKGFDFWSWYESDGDKPEKPPKDHKKAVANAIKAGLDEDGDNKLTAVDLAKIMFAQKVDMRIMMSAIDKLAALQDLDK